MSDLYCFVKIPNRYGGSAIVDLSKIKYVKQTKISENNRPILVTIFQFADCFIQTPENFNLLDFINGLDKSVFVNEDGFMMKMIDAHGDPCIVNMDNITMISTTHSKEFGPRTFIYFENDTKRPFDDKCRAFCVATSVDEIYKHLNRDHFVNEVQEEMELAE